MTLSRRAKWTLLVTIAFVGFVLDWVTKHAAVCGLKHGVPLSVVGDYVQLLLVYNKGALFGLDPGAVIPGFPVNLFFYVFSVMAIAVLLVYYARLGSASRLLHWGVALVMPGALGNLFDRIVHPGKGVVDFVKVGISETVYWPIFNMADAYITVGVCFILVDLWLQRRRKKAGDGAAPRAPGSTPA